MMNPVAAVGVVGDLLSAFRPDAAGASSGGGSVAQSAAQPSFLDALSQVTGNAVTDLGKAQGLAINALQGDVATREVVDAVMSAEQSLQTAIAIRDKIVTAYLEISRMAI